MQRRRLICFAKEKYGRLEASVQEGGLVTGMMEGTVASPHSTSLQVIKVMSVSLFEI